MNRAELIQHAKPLGFTEAMYRAVVEGRKTQTRRICDLGFDFTEGDFRGPEWGQLTKIDCFGEEYPGKPVFGIWSEHGWGAVAKYAPGDAVYLTEPVQILAMSGNPNGAMCDVAYQWERYDVPNTARDIYLHPDAMRKVYARKRGWNVPTTARFMLKSFAREFARVTDVRLERVQDISEADAEAEGANPASMSIYGDNYIGFAPSHRDVPIVEGLPYTVYRAGFSRLWDSINAKRGYSWDSNPWVWVYEFERLGAEG